MLFWRITGPVATALVPLAPWWVTLETVGRKSGQARRTPLARGPIDGSAMWLVAVHGRHTGWVKNVEACADVRLRRGFRWRDGTASVEPLTPELLQRFNAYARSGPRHVGIDPVAVRVDWSGGA